MRTKHAGKYNAEKTTVDGIPFDSKREAKRYAELRMLEKAGQISGLMLQVPFLLAHGVRLHGEKRQRPAVRYVADFVYSCPIDGIVVEDSKGMDTPMSRLKRHLMATVLNIYVRIT